jgi:hypothetical protein
MRLRPRWFDTSWDCEMLAMRMTSEIFEPAINMLFVNARGEVARVSCSMQQENGEYCTDDANVLRDVAVKENE